MKHLKLYENYYEKKFELSDGSFWYIRKKETFLKFTFDVILNYRDKQSLYDIYDELCKMKDIGEGIYLYYKRKAFRYFILNNENEKIGKKSLLLSNDYEYMGEIKTKLGRILVDTLEIDTDKYNL